MKTWFYSDTHFGHQNIIKYCKRPFSSSEEMDAEMVTRWNDRVRINDEVWHLGDFCFGGANKAEGYFSQLNGQIHMLENYSHHDGSWWYPNPHFESKCGLVTFEPPIRTYTLPRRYWVDSQHARVMVLCHFPIHVWDRKHYLSWHIYGHVHVPHEIPDSPLSMNVAADQIGFAPISLDDLAEIFLKREKDLGLKPIGEK